MAKKRSTIQVTTTLGEETGHDRHTSTSKLVRNLPPLSTPTLAATSPSHIRIKDEPLTPRPRKAKKKKALAGQNLEKMVKKTRNWILVFDAINSVFAAILIALSYVEVI